MDTDFKGCPLWRPASRVSSTAGIGASSWRIHPGGKTSISDSGAAAPMPTSLYFYSLCHPHLATSIRGGCQAAGCGNAETSALPMPVLRSFQLVAILRLNSAN